MASLHDTKAPVQPGTLAELIATVAAALAVRGLCPTVNPAGVEVTVGGRRVRLAAVAPVRGGSGESWDGWPRDATRAERRALWDEVRGEVVAYNAEG